MIKLYSLIILVILLTSCASYSVNNQKYESNKKIDICKILKKNTAWYSHAKRASMKWNIHLEHIFAIIWQESKFKANARPFDERGRLKSSAYGFAQALDQTWQFYIEKTNNIGAKRDNFADSVDFIGWYNEITIQKNSIAKHRIDLLYINYHEGWGGYSRGTHHKKSRKWIKSVAKKVSNQAKIFKNQLKKCKTKYIRRSTNDDTGVKWF